MGVAGRILAGVRPGQMTQQFEHCRRIQLLQPVAVSLVSKRLILEQTVSCHAGYRFFVVSCKVEKKLNTLVVLLLECLSCR